MPAEPAVALPSRNPVLFDNRRRGFEHCIANMYLIPLSMALGSGISVGARGRRRSLPLAEAARLMAGAGLRAQVFPVCRFASSPT